MKNRIWLGMNKAKEQFISVRKLVLKDGVFVDKDGDRIYSADDDGFNEYVTDYYNLNLKPLEIVEVIIDTETQKYEVVRPREVGWYLVECLNYDDDGIVFACHWNGKNWAAVRNKNKWKRGTIWGGIPDDKITVLSDKLPDNEHLRSLE